MKKIGIIGNFAINAELNDGQTVKTREIYKVLKKMEYDVFRFDTYNIISKPLKIFKYSYMSLKKCDVVIIILSSRGYLCFLPILVFFNSFFKKKIFDFVIGGNRQNILANKKYYLKLQSKINKIYVETPMLVEEYRKIKVDNVELLPNFKELPIIDIDTFNINQELRICTFSRVMREKGIEEAIEVVKRANERLNKNAYYLDIYGMVDNNYAERFNDLIKQFPEFIKYNGQVNPSESTETLKSYFLLLFLTFHKGEGMAGTLIDALFAGLPVIATDWNFNKEIIKEDKTGKIVNIHDINAVVDLLVFFYNNQEKVFNMRKECLKEAQKYLPENVIKKFVQDIE